MPGNSRMVSVGRGSRKSRPRRASARWVTGTGPAAHRGGVDWGVQGRACAGLSG